MAAGKSPKKSAAGSDAAETGSEGQEAGNDGKEGEKSDDEDEIELFEINEDDLHKEHIKVREFDEDCSKRCFFLKDNSVETKD